MATITTHILDISAGRPAAGVRIELEAAGTGGGFTRIAEGLTDDDGRVKSWSTEPQLASGDYRLRFYVKDYFAGKQTASFYPLVEITFTVGAADEHYHVPLLLSPFGYSTYRGS